jgi:hypothetical protein
MIINLSQEEKDEILKNFVLFLSQENFIAKRDTYDGKTYIQYNIEL